MVVLQNQFVERIRSATERVFQGIYTGIRRYFANGMLPNQEIILLLFNYAD